MATVREVRREAYNDYHRVYMAEWRTRPAFEETLGASDDGRANFQRLGLKCTTEAMYALWFGAARRADTSRDMGTLAAFCRDCMRSVAEDMRAEGRCVNPKRFR